MTSAWTWVAVLTCGVLASASYLPASEMLLSVFLMCYLGDGSQDGHWIGTPPDTFLHLRPQRLQEEADELEGGLGIKKIQDPALPLDYEELALSPSLRDQEYLAHSTLLGSVLSNYEDKMKQQHKPSPAEGKSSTGSTSSSDGGSSGSADGVLPAYCNPPNPCPLGYTAADGCLEVFENTAAFSRDYQALQDCMCDTEHMFECEDSTQDSEITALARSIQNEGVLDSTLDKIMSGLTEERNHRLVAKKFHQKKSVNPYLMGEKLPVAAKKGGMM